MRRLYTLRMSAIESNPEILGGTPCFAGTRVPVETLIDHLRRGYTVDYFLDQFPTVTREQVDEVLELVKQGFEIRRAAG
ncbi:MAG: DUF433 domain-containing protein [Phycisphaeraceae bacterium]|nr:MAG: DUF433 domain-containing protein [Phycisphaeraceae bacterium]